MKTDLTVEYEDGNTENVTVGQREMAAYEMEFNASSIGAFDTRPMLFFRYLAYAHLKMRGRLAMHKAGKNGTGAERPETFEEWSARVENVEPTDEPEAADPTTASQQPEG